MRDLYNIYDNPYPLPYFGTQAYGPPGYIFDYGCTVANRSTSSAAVIRGVRQNENPNLTTIFAVLGSPHLSLAFPLWPFAAYVPIYLSSPGGPPIAQFINARKELYMIILRPYSI